MQVSACGVSIPNFMAFDEVSDGACSKPHVFHMDDDGSTSAGSSDLESDVTDRKSQPSPTHALAVPFGSQSDALVSMVYLMGALSCATHGKTTPKPNATPAAGKKIRKHKISPKVSSPPGLFVPQPEFVVPPGFSVPGGFLAPPGLPPPPGLSHFGIAPPGFASLGSGFAAPPGLAPPGLALPLGITLAEPAPVFDPKVFRRELVSILKELSESKNVAAAVRRVRAQQVPLRCQAAETVDILTRAADENRGNPRRLCFAFVAGLARGSPTAFEKAEVLSGIKSFFREIYEDLCEEVPRLPHMMATELVPTLREVFPAEAIELLLPSAFRVA